MVLAEFDATLQKLANADVQIDSLKQQLDDALGAEDMLVQLTERNLLLGEVYTGSLSSSLSHTFPRKSRK